MERTSVKLALSVSIFQAILPSVILNIAYPFYTCVTALGYSLIAFGFHLTKRYTLRSLSAFSTGIILLTFTRQSFTLVHVLLSCLWFYFLGKDRFRESKLHLKKLLLTLFLLTMILPAKNLYYYGFFGSSSWLPQTLASGWKLSSPLGPFPSPSKIAETYPTLKCSSVHTRSDVMFVKSNGQPNFHSCLLLEYSKVVLKNGLEGYDPEKHLKGIIDYVGEYFSLPDEYKFLTNRENIRFYAELMEIPQLAVTYTFFTKGSTHELRLILIFPIILLLTIC
jgi:hypothetical protein